MRLLILITNCFPYCPGEEFLEVELPYWQKQNSFELIVMPRSEGSGSKRSCAEKLQLELGLARSLQLGGFERLSEFGLCFFNKLFYSELSKYQKVNLSEIPYILGAVTRFKRCKRYFKEYLKGVSDIQNTIFYTYWNSEAYFALQSLRQEYGFRLVSRAHGYDLYRERRKYGYMPFKNFREKDAGQVHVLSKKAREYILSEYGTPPSNVFISNLGVEDPGIRTTPSKEGIISLVSCSQIVEVKNLKVLIEGLFEASTSTADQLRWIHIGDGPDMDTIRTYAQNTLKDRHNVVWNLAGHKTREEILEIYRSKRLDAFINVSKSEGQPVSIMEAFSMHLPVIAPDVGGIGEMFKNFQGGFLLNRKVTAEDIASAILKAKELKHSNVKSQAYENFTQKFDASNVYPEFIKAVAG